MSKETNQQAQTTVVGIVLVAAILMIVAVPLITNSMLNPIISGQLARIDKFLAQGTPEGNTQAAVIKVIPWTISFIFPLWASLSFISGFVLFAVAKPFRDGESWARRVVLTALAIPSIGGAFMLVPWMNFVGSVSGGFPPAVFISAIGLIPYFTVILVGKSDWRTKVANSLVFLMLGVTAAENFANAHAAFRIYAGHPKRPLFVEGIPVLWLCFISLWICTIFLVLAIYKLGARSKTAWYLSVIAGSVTFVASLVTHYFRHTTNDYLYGALMGLTIVALMLIPWVRDRIFDPSPVARVETKTTLQSAAV